ncbi:hypothetical protein AK830_g9662 [Neonectria ditissima]|uniref:SUN domain-containing protein n=1 Tax=Neonectria ditissima TaxID=78410 RepID=A0A0P7BBZ0_9HYPO|nr:hypothetical protein AK830_g9662 [Neonectria ditissima]
MPSPWLNPLCFVVLTILGTSHITAAADLQNRTRETDATRVATTCDAITINYITHSLPQSCLTNTWTSTGQPTIDASLNATINTADSDAIAPTSSGDLVPDATSTESQHESQDVGDGSNKPFMSFEDWKEMMLRKTGQDPQDLGSRNPNQRRPDDRAPPDMGHAGLGEEDEISLNFDSYLDNSNKAGDQREYSAGSHSDGAGEAGVGDPVAYDDGLPSTSRSKDAGKTCKERFSYSSFDAGATVLKSGRGAKNTKAILVENKDSYMLLECSTPEKFVIVELSDDILIDTIVLANFEFFSSMIRHFRVSVSDRYPVKTEWWKELGTFEARNSRDIQPFLIENPQIWAKYVQIEFLTHYGNEYYCPVSLLRVHGSRMLDSWKDTHAEDEPEMAQVDSPKEAQPASKVEVPDQHETADTSSSAESPSTCATTARSHVFVQTAITCEASPSHTEEDMPPRQDARIAHSGSERAHDVRSDSAEGRGTSKMHVAKTESSRVEDVPTAPPTTASPTVLPSVKSVSSSSSSTSSRADVAVNSTAQVTSTKPASNSDTSTTVVSINKPSPSGAPAGKNRTSGTGGSSTASPPVQEGFFKAITKRLHQVESNLTLSLQYVEDQARHLQESLHRTEQKQISKAQLFLENLNQTVLAELRSVREQYDQIWQSTVIALETQREQSQREIVALSARLNFLADEVVFQKRMAIVQAVLLLSCLILVIFSRGASLPYLAPLMDQASGTPFLSSASPRTRGLYQPAFNAARDEEPLFDKQEVDYLPATLSTQGHYANPISRLHDQHSDENLAAPLQCERLSPPTTPNLVDDLVMPKVARQPHPVASTDLRYASSVMQSSPCPDLQSIQVFGDVGDWTLDTRLELVLFVDYSKRQKRDIAD